MHKDTLDIMRRVMHSNMIYMRTKLEELGLYGGQPKVILLLSKENGLTKKELSERFEVAAPTITKMIERMEKNGFVYTQKDEEDKRITRVYIADKGLEVLRDLKTLQERISEVYFEGMTEAEIDMFHNYLERVRDNIRSSDVFEKFDHGREGGHGHFHGHKHRSRHFGHRVKDEEEK